MQTARVNLLNATSGMITSREPREVVEQPAIFLVDRLSRRGAVRAEDAQGTPTQSHKSQVYQHTKNKPRETRENAHLERVLEVGVDSLAVPLTLPAARHPDRAPRCRVEGGLHKFQSSSASLVFAGYSSDDVLGVRHERVNFGAEESLVPQCPR